MPILFIQFATNFLLILINLPTPIAPTIKLFHLAIVSICIVKQHVYRIYSILSYGTCKLSPYRICMSFSLVLDVLALFSLLYFCGIFVLLHCLS